MTDYWDSPFMNNVNNTLKGKEGNLPKFSRCPRFEMSEISLGALQREVRATPEIRNKLTDSRRSLLTRARLTTQGKKGYPSSKHQFVTHSITNIRSSTNSYEESTRKVYFYEILKTEKLLLIRPGEDKTKKKTKIKSKEGLMRLKLQIPLLFP